jgi:exopolysaccharide biosynthesis polyprenyl glycosylphosphotransferase
MGVEMELKKNRLLTRKHHYLNLLIGFETFLILLLTLLAVRIRNVGQNLTYDTGLKESVLLFTFPIIWLACLSLFGAWDIRILENHIDGYRLLIGASFMTFLAFCSSSYLFKIQLSRFVILFSLIGGTILHLIVRWVFLRLVESKLGIRDVTSNWLVLQKTDQLDKEIAKAASIHQATVGILVIETSNFSLWVKEVTSEIQDLEISRTILVDVSSLSPFQVQQLMWAVQETSSEFVAIDHLGLAASQSRLQYYQGLNWVGFGAPRINESLRFIKRVFDLLLVVPAIVLLLPVFLVIAILIKIDSPGKILFTQKRVGVNGELFTFPKFRSMRQGSEKDRLSVLGRPDGDMATRYKQDPRVTRVGRVLRRFSLDELPQFFCVLVGSMSLVGPRPILPEESVQLGDFHFRRQIAKPGLTGIWQVSGRKEVSWEDRMAFDIKYVEEWSVSLDLILIARTFRAILGGKGSY